ncbi:MAG: hypothetical protein Faunusvirus1_33 [Faunusvirus sp.]|jgi:hypothetical protein|uniref:Uncharacterized protein n=1 Tax=Faunusvirus sp. TaxID=2487766 RepID=A0A3G4ZZK8_9VIRU|nr:MAG: hypothetical protein Faunusvirus1_33 [Faunusvirus sp.]
MATTPTCIKAPCVKTPVQSSVKSPQSEDATFKGATTFEGAFAELLSLWSTQQNHKTGRIISHLNRNTGLIVAQYYGDWIEDDFVEEQLCLSLKQRTYMSTQQHMSFDERDYAVLTNGSCRKFVLAGMKAHTSHIYESKTKLHMHIEMICNAMTYDDKLTTLLLTNCRDQFAQALKIPPGLRSLWQQCTSLQQYHDSLAAWDEEDGVIQFERAFRVCAKTVAGKSLLGALKTYSEENVFTHDARYGKESRYVYEARSTLIYAWNHAHPDDPHGIYKLLNYKMKPQPITGRDLRIKPIADKNAPKVEIAEQFQVAQLSKYHLDDMVRNVTEATPVVIIERKKDAFAQDEMELIRRAQVEKMQLQQTENAKRRAIEARERKIAEAKKMKTAEQAPAKKKGKR